MPDEVGRRSAYAGRAVDLGAAVPTCVTRPSSTMTSRSASDEGVDGVVGDEEPGAGEGRQGGGAARPGPRAGCRRRARRAARRAGAAGARWPAPGRARPAGPARPTAPAARAPACAASPRRSSQPSRRRRALGLRAPRERQAEGDVVERGEAGEQEVVLEDHADRPRSRRDERAGGRVVEDHAVELDAAPVERLQPGDGPQHRGLAGAVRARGAATTSPSSTRQLDVEVEVAERATSDRGLASTVIRSASCAEPAVAQRDEHQRADTTISTSERAMAALAVGLEGEEHGEGHRLGAALEVAGERDGGAELARGPGPSTAPRRRRSTGATCGSGDPPERPSTGRRRGSPRPPRSGGRRRGARPRR